MLRFVIENWNWKAPFRYALGRPVAAIFAALLLAGIAGGTVYLRSLVPDLPGRDELAAPAWNLSTVVFTADELEIARFQRENRTWIAYDAISLHVTGALLATEDHRFFSHGGIDLIRLASSALQSLFGDRQGGSTVTMQLVRNLFPGIQKASAHERKLQEILIAFRLERIYGKPEILEMYLNTVPFGNNAFGIEAAAQTYFGTSAARLDVLESAVLIGILKGSSWYNPVRHPERALQRRNIVLGLMARRGYLDAAKATELKNEPLGLDFHPPATAATGIAPHFAEHVRAWAEEWAGQNGYDLYADGLRIYTTLDSRMQAGAQAAVDEQMRQLQAVIDYEWSRRADFFLSPDPAAYMRAAASSPRPAFSYFWEAHPDLADGYIRGSARYRDAVAQGTHPEAAYLNLRLNAAFMDSLSARAGRLEAGLVALDPANGHVKAWIGGRDFALDQYDKVALAKRQPGSTFKPFVFAAALEHGYTADQPVYDPPQSRSPEPVHIEQAGSTLPAATLRTALAYSSNAAATHLVRMLTPHRVAAYAARMGIGSELKPVESLGLGTSEVTLLELVGAYGTLANRGFHREPVVVTHIESHDGRVLARFDPPARRTVSSYTAFGVVDMLRDAVDYGTGREIRTRFGVTADVAGKTGTTQHSADGWFVLMHPTLVAGSWVGFNDRRITFRSDHWGEGGHNALYVAGAFFERLLRESSLLNENARFAPPPGYVASRRARTFAGAAAPMDSVALVPEPYPEPRLTHDADVEKALRQQLSAPVAEEIGGSD